MRIFGPSAHQTGPSPSYTATGVHVNVCPAGMIGVAESASDPNGPKVETSNPMAILVTKRIIGRKATARPRRASCTFHAGFG
jgi:hypothetical protein